MKPRITLSLTLCLTALLVVFTMPTQGQIHSQLTFNLPETASVHGVALPAGQVVLEQMDLAGGSPVLVFRSADGKTVSVLAEQIEVSNARTASGTQIVMRRTAHGLEIDKVWIAGQAFGFQLLQSAE